MKFVRFAVVVAALAAMTTGAALASVPMAPQSGFQGTHPVSGSGGGGGHFQGTHPVSGSGGGGGHFQGTHPVSGSGGGGGRI